MGFDGASGFHPPGGGGGGGGTIGGGGTLNYVAMFTPDGLHVSNAPIKVGPTVTRALPINSGTNSIGMGYDIVMSGLDSFLIGYGLVDNGGQEVYAFGNRLTMAGAGPYYGILALGFLNFFDSPGGPTSGIYLMGDSNIFHDFNTYSTIIGEDNTLTRIDHCTILGLFNTITDSVHSFLLGESNNINLSTTIALLGDGNSVNSCNDVVVVGSTNAVSSITNATVIGISNLNALSNEVLIAISDNGIRINSAGDVGIGIPSINPILAKNHIRGVEATTKSNQRLEPVAGTYEDTTGEQITTVDGLVPVAVPLQTIAIPLNTVVMIESYITCRKTAGAGAGVVGDGNGYVRTVLAQNIAGVVTIGVIQSSFTSEVIPANDATFSPIGTNVLLNVLGSINNTFDWNVITKTYPVV